MNVRAKLFVGGEDTFRDIFEHLRSPHAKPVVITGEHGTGKTRFDACLAHCCCFLSFCHYHLFFPVILFDVNVLSPQHSFFFFFFKKKKIILHNASSLMANFLILAKQRKPWKFIYHFVGCSSKSTTIVEILQRLCKQLAELCGQPVDLTDMDVSQLSGRLTTLLVRVPCVLCML